jgi:hypothetical protein
MDAIVADDLEGGFRGRPWDVTAEVDRRKLYACLDGASRDQAAVAAIAVIEAGNATHRTVGTVLDLIFPDRRPVPRHQPPLADRDLSPRQRRAVRAMAAAMEGGRRIFHGHFSQWRLSGTVPGWRALASADGADLPASVAPPGKHSH